MLSTSGMSVEIRSGLQPGDIGEITRLHGEIYAAEYGLGGIEASIAESLGTLVKQGWPSAREDVWIVEAGGERVGCVILYEREEGLARLGMLVLRPEHRGAGLGRRLVELCLERARSAGYEQIELMTLSRARGRHPPLPRGRLPARGRGAARALGPRDHPGALGARPTVLTVPHMKRQSRAMQRDSPALASTVNARVLIALFLLAVFALGAVVLVARARQDDAARRRLRQPLRGRGACPEGLKAPDFALRDQDGERVSMRDLRGRPVIVTFLYTTCEDSCPLQAQTVRGALDQLGHDVPALAIAVDPPRDTPERARAFLSEQRALGRHRLRARQPGRAASAVEGVRHPAPVGHPGAPGPLHPGRRPRLPAGGLPRGARRRRSGWRTTSGCSSEES